MKPTAIITGDIHLREDRPVCRTDDYFEAQTRKIKWLCDLQEEHNVPILDAGDLFAKSKPSHFMTQWAIRNLPDEFHTIPGNHDLPSHNLSLLNKSALGVLDAAGAVVILEQPLHMSKDSVLVFPFPWGSVLHPHPDEVRTSVVALCHVMTFTGETPWPGCVDLPARQLLRHMKEYDLVITGHNHKAFVVKSRGRLLVNPGSLMRSSASQIDFKPRVYLWYMEDNHVEPVYVPIEEDVVTTKHLDMSKEKDKRINAFVEKLNEDIDISSSFVKNMEEYLKKNKTSKIIREIVWSALGE